MVWSPVTGLPIQYSEDASGTAASGNYLKFYASGTTTPINMATDSTGGTTLAKCQLNSLGQAINGSSAVFIPHIDQKYKAVLYPDSTTADANTFASAIWVVDGITPPGVDALVSVRASGEFVKEFDTMAAAIASTTLVVGDVLLIKDRANSHWDVVLSSGVTENGRNIVQCVGVGTLSFVLRDNEIANVREFGADGTGATDDTAIFEEANSVSLTIQVPPGVYNTTNWVPLEGTVILAHGATIQRGATTTYGATGSSAAIVIANDSVKIYGGKITDKSGLSQATFSGGILIDGGSNFAANNTEITGLWAGVFGNAAQNGTNLANDATLNACWIHDNQHNTYFADIDGLIVNGSVLERANRDGMKTYRNVKNISITSNIIRDNGDGTVGQSRDGLDLFIAGNTIIISGNQIYNNEAKGIDIKRNATGDPETLENHKIIITGNHIYGNGGEGIQNEVVDGVGYVENLSVYGNHVYNNSARGIYCTYVRHGDISHNHIYGNVTDGIRLDDVDDIRVIGNHVTDNTGTGINMVSGDSVYVMGNQVKGTANQVNGILMGSSLTASVCRDNDSTGHSSVDYQCYGTAFNVRGKTLNAKIENTTASQFLGFTSKGSVSGLEVMLDNTATMDVTVTKYSDTAGTSVGNIASNAGVSFATTRVAVQQSITGSNSVRNLAGSNAILLTLANITSSFVTGYARLHYID